MSTPDTRTMGNPITRVNLNPMPESTLTYPRVNRTLTRVDFLLQSWTWPQYSLFSPADGRGRGVWLEPNKTTAKNVWTSCYKFLLRPAAPAFICFFKTVIETPTQDHESSVPLAKIKKRFFFYLYFACSIVFYGKAT
jgi:hypothetical protein